MSIKKRKSPVYNNKKQRDISEPFEDKLRSFFNLFYDIVDIDINYLIKTSKTKADDGKYNADLQDIVTKQFIELKINMTHSYSGNHFVERWSDYDKKTPGGPWQYENRAEHYVFYYPKTGDIHIFNTKDIIKALEPIEHKLKRSFVTNIEKRKNGTEHKYHTFGYKVNKEMLSALIPNEQIFNLDKMLERHEKNINIGKRKFFKKGKWKNMTLDEMYENKEGCSYLSNVVGKYTSGTWARVRKFIHYKELLNKEKETSNIEVS